MSTRKPSFSRKPSTSRKLSATTVRKPSVTRGFSMAQTTQSARKKRDILYTNQLQLIVQSLQPGEGVEKEVHRDIDQFIRVERGKLTVTVFATKSKVSHKVTLEAGGVDTIIIPQNTYHELRNNTRERVAFYTLYAPPAH